MSEYEAQHISVRGHIVIATMGTLKVALYAVFGVMIYAFYHKFQETHEAMWKLWTLATLGLLALGYQHGRFVWDLMTDTPPARKGEK